METRSIQQTEPQTQSNNDEKNIKQKQKHNHAATHSSHNPDQLDSDCEGCQIEKKENEKLVDFYQRLDKMTLKVKNIKKNKNSNQINKSTSTQSQTIRNEASQPQPHKVIVSSQDLQKKLKQLDQKLNISQLPSVHQIKDYSSKQIGFQLAAALLQRQMKFKSENRKLQAKIDELLLQKKVKQQNQSQLFTLSKSKLSKINSQQSNSQIFNNNEAQQRDSNYNRHEQKSSIKDSLDYFKDPKGSQKIKQKDDASYWDLAGTTTNKFKNPQTTFFQTKHQYQSNKAKFNIIKQRQNQIQNQSTGINKKKGNPYNTEGYGLNLWLYQFKADQFGDNMMSSWLSQKNNAKRQTNQKYKTTDKTNNQAAKNKSSRQSSVNKTSIIQKNILNDFNPSPPQGQKKKRY